MGSLRARHLSSTAAAQVTPLRAVWGPDARVVLVGNMKRGLDVFDARTGALVSHEQLCTGQ